MCPFTSKLFLKLAVIFHEGLVAAINDSLMLLQKVFFLSNTL